MSIRLQVDNIVKVFEPHMPYISGPVESTLYPNSPSFGSWGINVGIPRVEGPYIQTIRQPQAQPLQFNGGPYFSAPNTETERVTLLRRLLIITTNVGWNKQGENVMGAGLARQYRDRISGLAEAYGKFLRRYTVDWEDYFAGKPSISTTLLEPSPDHYIYLHFDTFLMVPTKALNPQRPWLSWQSDSSLVLIERSLKQLVAFLKLRKLDIPETIIYTPLFGCGKGNLDPKDVLPLMVKYMAPTKAQFVLVSPSENLSLPEPPPPPPEPTEADLRVAALLGDINDSSK